MSDGSNEGTRPDDHRPFTDDGVTYCGFDGNGGCGELWPCSTVRGRGEDYPERSPAPTPEEVAELLRSVEFALSHGRTAMVAFFDTKYEASAIERDYDRMREVERQVKAMLDRLPPEPPMTPERMEKVGAVVGAALRKRFGEGTAEELDAAVQAAWPDV